MPTQVSLLDGALASAGTLAIQTNGTTSAITISSAQVATFVNNPIMTGLTASRAVFTDGSKGLTSNAITGTGNVVMSASPTLTGTISGAAITLSSDLTLSGGTANGVLYLNGSKVATSGSALTFDGTNLGIGTSSPADILHLSKAGDLYLRVANTSTAINAYLGQDSNGTYIGNTGASVVRFIQGGSERMRIDTSGNVGIGTSSPNSKLNVNNGFLQIDISGTQAVRVGSSDSIVGGTTNNAVIQANTSKAITFLAGGTETARIDGAGNLGLGVTPSAWRSTDVALQVRRASLWDDGSNAMYLGQNVFENTSGSYIYIGSDYASIYRQQDGAHAFYTAPSGTAGNAITFTQAMTLDASGNLGLGTTSPTTRLSITDSAGPVVRLVRTSNRFEVAADNDYMELNARDASTYIRFKTADTERARIDSSGNLLIGTTSSAANSGTGVKLLPSGYVYVVAPSTTSDTYNYYNSTAGAYRFYVTNAGVINATSTTITAISDQRLKENIQDIDVGLDAVMALKPRKFDWKAGKGKDKKGDRGWIAQEFEQVFPDMITTWKDEPPEGEEPYKAVNADLIPVLVKAIQELKAEFDAYKATHP